MVGSLATKGHIDLLDALPVLLSRFPDIRVVFAGQDGEQGGRRRIEDRVTELGLWDRVVFAGVRDDVPAVLAASDVLVHLPREEAFGLAAAEAMAAGLPVIASKVGGCQEIVRDLQTGFLISPGDTAALTHCLHLLFDGKEGVARRARLGSAGRRIAERCFSRRRQIVALEQLYQDLCDGKRGSD
jgi:glycosyltransferase involved in cell wall biosynthesis